MSSLTLRRSAARAAAPALIVALALIGGCKARTSGSRALGLLGPSAAGGNRVFILYTDAFHANACMTHCATTLFDDVAQQPAPPVVSDQNRYCDAAASCRTVKDFFQFWKGLGIKDSAAGAALLGNVFDDSFAVRLPLSASPEDQSAWSALGPQVTAIEQFFQTAPPVVPFAAAQENALVRRVADLLKAKVLKFDVNPATQRLAAQNADAAKRLTGQFFWGLRSGTYLRVDRNPVMTITVNNAALDGGAGDIKLATTTEVSGADEQYLNQALACDATTIDPYNFESQVTQCRFKKTFEGSTISYDYKLKVESPTQFLYTEVRNGDSGSDYEVHTYRFRLLDKPAVSASGFVCNLQPAVSGLRLAGRPAAGSGEAAGFGRLYNDYRKAQGLSVIYPGDVAPTLKQALISSCDACLWQASRGLLTFAKTLDGPPYGADFACAEPICYEVPSFRSLPDDVNAQWYLARDSGFSDQNFFAYFVRRCSSLTTYSVVGGNGPYWRTTPENGLEFSQEYSGLESYFRARGKPSYRAP